MGQVLEVNHSYDAAGRPVVTATLDGEALDISQCTINATMGEPLTRTTQWLSSGLIDVESGTSWGDLPPDDWQQEALLATTAKGTLEETIVVASREPATGEFIYVRCGTESALQLMQRLAEALDQASSQPTVPLEERRCGKLDEHLGHTHHDGTRWCDGQTIVIEQEASSGGF